MNVVILSFLLLLTVFGNSYAAPKTEEYELQERCGHSAGEYYKHKYGHPVFADKNLNITQNYASHYSKKLNKCFILVISTTFNNNDFTITREKYLSNFQQNSSLAIFKQVDDKIIYCGGFKKMCQSENEFDSLVKPYMEE
jgi:hypothetical protein